MSISALLPFSAFEVGQTYEVPGPPPHTALVEIWVTPTRPLALTAFSPARRSWGLPRLEQPSDCAHRPSIETFPGL